MSEVEAPPPQTVEEIEEQAEHGPVIEQVRVDAAPPPKKKPTYLPEDTEFQLAKSFLVSKMGSKHPVSLYDHMSRMVQYCLEQRPNNAVDSFEALSFELKRNRAAMNLDSFGKNVANTHLALEKVKTQLKYLKPEPSDPTELGEIPDMIDLARLWEWAGVSFGNEGTFLLFLSIKKLVEERQLKSVRLWGKINGLQSNYIIVEAELKDGVVDDEDAIVNKPAKSVEKDESATKGKQTAKPLTRETKTGTNKYVYYTCSDSKSS
jgi:radial spoke head protein 4/6